MSLRIDRLTVRMFGLSEFEGRRLARLIGEHLQDAPSLEPGDVSHIAVDLDERMGETLESTARRIAERVILASARALP
jgi:hypothetical protein